MSNPVSERETLDITRLNRKTRRDLRKRTHLTIPGRNLPYVKANHGDIHSYYQTREEEIKKDVNPTTTETRQGNSK